MRVLVTASRKWSEPRIIEGYLEDLYQWWLDQHPGPAERFIVVHGKARGGDTIAMEWVQQRRRWDQRIDHEPHPADWNTPCGEHCHHQRRRRDGTTFYACAGYVRNQEMVDSNIDVCMGFPLDGPGTPGCLELARDVAETYRYADGRMTYLEPRKVPAVAGTLSGAPPMPNREAGSTTCP